MHLPNVSLGSQVYLAYSSDWKGLESSLMGLSGPGQTNPSLEPQVPLQGTLHPLLPRWGP